jgi:hypothetical protein
VNSFIDGGRFVVGNDDNFLDVSRLFLIPFTPIDDVGVRRPLEVIFGFIDGSEFRITVVFGNGCVFEVVGTVDFGRCFVC